jgi:dTDP-glucose 4,6-dehydratase
MKSKRWLVTGGLGFIGSHFIRYALNKDPELEIVNLDKLTYAGNLENTLDFKDNPRYQHLRGDITNAIDVSAASYKCKVIVNFAAESHVDRSISGDADFIQTNVAGTGMLLNAARAGNMDLFVQVSTDEVYGEVMSGFSKEDEAFRPRSPYAASKAAAEHLVQSYFETHRLPTIITRGSNTYGPNQYPEKLVPLAITNLLLGKKIPVYGDGLQSRQWLWVEDHARGIYQAIKMGKPGEAYNLGGRLSSSCSNLLVLHTICALLEESPINAIEFVADRKGHDRRYAIDSFKATYDLDWYDKMDVTLGLRKTVMWYQANRAWWEPLRHEKALV